MVVVEQILLLFKVKWVYFAERPVDMKGCDIVIFVHCSDTGNIDKFIGLSEATAVADLTRDLDVIWGKLSSTRRRYIRRAEESNLKIEINQNYDQFYEINKSFQHKKGFYSILDPQHPTIEEMKKYGTLFTVSHDGEILGGSLYVEDSDHIKLWVSASKRLETGTDKEKAGFIGRANSLLTWETMKYARNKGIKTYDWGGLWPENEAALDPSKQNLNFFKLSFGGEPVVCVSYRKFYSPVYLLGQYIYRKFQRA